MKTSDLKEGQQVQFEVLGPGWVAGSVHDGGVESNCIFDRGVKGWWRFDVLRTLKVWPGETLVVLPPKSKEAPRDNA